MTARPVRRLLWFTCLDAVLMLTGTPSRAQVIFQNTNGPRGGGSTGGVGGEVQVLKGVFFRAGYASQSQVTGGSGLDAVSGLTFGFGLKQPRWSFDYAAAPMGELGNTQRFSAAIRW
jgi:hypothetical protein